LAIPTVLCVAEKPSVARTASSILSSGHSRIEETRDKYIKNFHFPGKFLGQDANLVFTSVLGHLVEIDFSRQYEQWSAVEPGALFRADIVARIPEKFRELTRNLENLSRTASFLMLWLDNDREGENIAEEVERVCKKANPQLDVYRARFSALSGAELWHALNHPDRINRSESRAVTLRRELDLRTGSAFTRFQTLKFRAFAPATKVISYGPCQFPTLGFIVDAYMKRKNFVPEKFWLITCTLPKDGVTCDLKWCRKRLFCQLSCFAIYASTLDDPTTKVTNIHNERKLKDKPLPLSTVEFQRRVSKYLRIESHQAMAIAEKLYTGGFISYPRTETDSFPDNFDYQSIVHVLTQFDEVSQYATALEHRINRPRRGRHSDNAHPPIYPLKAPEGTMTNDEKRVYRFIAQHYLACCSCDAVGFETLVLFDVGGENFKLKGLEITERNWLDIYPYIRWEGKVIPTFTIGEVFHPTQLKMAERQTTAPPLLTEPQLIAKMDKEHIGTDATIAEHIQTIQERGYVHQVAREFVPLPLGLALVLGYESMGFDFAKPNLRADTERTMADVAGGAKDFEREMKRLVDQYEDAYERVKQQVHLLERSFQREMENAPQQPVQPRAHAQAPRGGARGGRGGPRGRGRGGAH
jgi:DNA topoisomerase-3